MTDKIREAFKSFENSEPYPITTKYVFEAGYLAGRQSLLEELEQVAYMSSRNGFICKDNKNHEYNQPIYRPPEGITK